MHHPLGDSRQITEMFTKVPAENPVGKGGKKSWERHELAKKFQERAREKL